jgi:hypothetical protein
MVVRKTIAPAMTGGALLFGMANALVPIALGAFCIVLLLLSVRDIHRRWIA